jgi:uncharacterized surface protein with fasciclin (FAS1) repeats
MGPVGRPRKAADPAVKTRPVTAAVAAQADLSSFAAVLKFVGADDELATATDADLIVYAPTNAALDAFAKEMTGNAKATAKDLLQPQYMPLLTHVVASHVTEDDDDDGVYVSFGGQKLLAVEADDDDDSKKAGAAKYEGTVTVLPSKKVSANILREEDLGGAGDLYVVDRVLKPDDVFATPTEAFKADPELATFGRLVKALAPELVQRADAGAPGTAFIPTPAAFAKFLAAANLTEAGILAGSPELKATVTGTLAYHVVPGVGLDTDSLADSDWTLKTALVVGPEPRNSSDKLTAADVVKTLKVAKVAKAGEAPVVQADLSKAKVTSQVYAGSEVLHKVDAVLVPAVGAPGQANKSMTPPQVKLPAVAAAAVKTVAPAVAGSGRKLMRATARNNIAANTQRANIRRAMSGSMSVAEATNLNSRVAAMAPVGRIPAYFLTSGASTRRGGFLV